MDMVRYCECLWRGCIEHHWYRVNSADWWGGVVRQRTSFVNLTRVEPNIIDKTNDAPRELVLDLNQSAITAE